MSERKLTAEEIALAEAKSKLAEAERKLKDLELENKQEVRDIKNKGDFRSGYFEFIDPVSASSVDYLLQNLRRYSRLYPGSDITIELQSPGGSIIDGFRCYDELLKIKNDGDHKLTIVARGQIASMAVPIFQAGDKRIIGPSCFAMVHRASYGAGGKAYEVEDQAEFVKLLEARIVEILASRTGQPESYFTELFEKRKDVWYTATQAVEVGLADEVG